MKYTKVITMVVGLMMSIACGMTICFAASTTTPQEPLACEIFGKLDHKHTALARRLVPKFVARTVAAGEVDKKIALFMKYRDEPFVGDEKEEVFVGLFVDCIIASLQQVQLAQSETNQSTPQQSQNQSQSGSITTPTTTTGSTTQSTTGASTTNTGASQPVATLPVLSTAYPTAVKAGTWRLNADLADINVESLTFANLQLSAQRYSHDATNLDTDDDTVVNDYLLVRDGKVYSVIRATNGLIKFRMPADRFVIPRDTEISFDVYVVPQQTTNAIDTSIKLQLIDLTATIKANGKTLTSIQRDGSSWRINGDTSTASLAYNDRMTTRAIYLRKSPLRVEVLSTPSDSLYPTTDRSLYRVRLLGNGAKLGGIAFHVYNSSDATLTGFALRASGDERGLSQLSSNLNATITPASIAPNSTGVVRFAFPDDIQSVYDGLYLDLRADITGTVDNKDSITVQIRSDDSVAPGRALDDQLTHNRNLVWSDGTVGRRTSADWYNGYLVPGLSTDSVTIRR